MRILFVCTGNTCRSPMAEMIFKDIVRKEKIEDAKISSAGIYAADGAEMCVYAKTALKNNGCRRTAFKSKRITKQMIDESDFVIVMTQSHKQMLSNFKNVHTLHELVGCGEIADPYGDNEEVYLKCFKQLKEALQLLSEKLF